jgi:hypothetical protein
MVKELMAEDEKNWMDNYLKRYRSAESIKSPGAKKPR